MPSFAWPGLIKENIRMTRFAKLFLISALAGTRGLVGCSDDGGTAGNGGGGTGGTAGDNGGGGNGGSTGDACEAPACIFCPAEALGPQGELIGDLTVPLDYEATPEGDVVQGETATIAFSGETSIEVPVSVTADVLEGSVLRYAATSGGDGALDVTIPEQTLMGTELTIDAGEGSGDFEVAEDATALVIGVESALIDLLVTSPVEISLLIDASETGDCSILGDGVSIPVSGAGGAGGNGGNGGNGGAGGAN